MQSLLAFLLLTLMSSVVARAQVRVWQGNFPLTTYDEGPPDPNPPFDQLATNRFNYPYTLRTNLTGRSSIHNWRAIFLENEYLKCAVLPDLGGHLYTCTDKIDGKPMFYANPSIKKANIGYRGAWAAFGVEYNFPVSHNWMSLSPVDFAFSQNRDGSAWVTVGNVDRVYGMEWSVEMLLRPKSTVLEQRVTLYNRSDVRHRFYWWNNAGVEVWDDSRIEYPMRFAASHGFTEVQPWPVDASGRDLSIIHNQTDGPVSLFVEGSREPFMGIWNPHTNSGTVHFANYPELPAKKIWSWGVDADGLDWRKALSDNNSAYVELQGGLFRNQETYAFLEPHQTIRFSEYWMPVRGIGGITRANLAGVIALKREAENLVLGFNANQPVPGASIGVFEDGKQVWSTTADLLPERTLFQKIPIFDAQQKYTVEILDRSGAVLMHHAEEQYDWTPVENVRVGLQEKHKMPSPDHRTEDDWLQLGATQELNGQLLLALETYERLLQEIPESYAGLKAAGRLSAALLHYEDAVRYLEPVRARNPTDPEAAYYLALGYEGIGKEGKARDAFEAAHRLPGWWKEAAALRLGEQAARRGDSREAERYLAEAKSASPDDERAAEEFSAWKTIHNDHSRSLAGDSILRFPLSQMLREELGSSDLQQLANDNNRILNLAREYMRLGIYAKALDVLSRSYPEPVPDQSEPATPAVAHDPMIAYYRAYCREKLGQSAASERRWAAHLSTVYVFPSSAEDLTVLRAATEKDPDDANAHYLLGTLYFSKAFTDRALAEWNRAKQLNPKIPGVDAGLGVALLHAKGDPASALLAFTDGIRSDAKNEMVYVGADQALSMLGKPSAERVLALTAYPDKANMPSDLVFELALNFAEDGKFDDATSLFSHRYFPRQEGGTNVRQVWIEAQLQHGLALAARGRCDDALTIAKKLAAPVPDLAFTKDGMQVLLDASRMHYFLGEIHAECGHAEEAAQYFQSAAGKTGAGDMFWAWKAAKGLPGFDQSQWTNRLTSAEQQAGDMIEASSFSGWWLYNRAMIRRALGHQQGAAQDLQSVFLLPDRLLSYHLAREAMTTKETSATK